MAPVLLGGRDVDVVASSPDRGAAVVEGEASNDTAEPDIDADYDGDDDVNTLPVDVLSSDEEDSVDEDDDEDDDACAVGVISRWSSSIISLK